MVECSDTSLYTGITTDIERRMRQHNGEIPGGAKYTRGRGPVRLIFSQAHENRSLASKQEYQLKHMSREQKLLFITTQS